MPRSKVVGAAGASRVDHLRYLNAFMAGLLARYLQRPAVDLAADGVGYRSVLMDLDDEEFREMTRALNQRWRHTSAAGGGRAGPSACWPRSRCRWTTSRRSDPRRHRELGLEPAKGLEPITCRLQGGCSTS